MAEVTVEVGGAPVVDRDENEASVHMVEQGGRKESLARPVQPGEDLPFFPKRAGNVRHAIGFIKLFQYVCKLLIH